MVAQAHSLFMLIQRVAAAGVGGGGGCKKMDVGGGGRKDKGEAKIVLWKGRTSDTLIEISYWLHFPKSVV
jgi:hypothetical protein